MVDFVFRLIGAVLGIVNNIQIIRGRRQTLRISILSHSSGEDRGSIRFHIANSSKEAISVKAIRLLVFIPQNGWQVVSERPVTLQQTAIRLPNIIEPGRALELKYCADDTFQANLCGQFYIEAESELDERYRSRKVACPTSSAECR